MSVERRNRLAIVIVLICFLFSARIVAAEDKPRFDGQDQPGGVIPKLLKTPFDPILREGRVYPNWGSVCQRYTYSVIYQDKNGKKPEYVKIYFNGQMIAMTPAFDEAKATAEEYKKGVRYEYTYVPNTLGSNFYYFEASNGLGKTRDAIIDSPDNGPVLFESAFDKNEVVLIDPSGNSGQGSVILRFSTGKEWIGGVSLSDDGKYLAVKASQHIYLFDTSRPAKPLWEFACERCRIGDDIKGGIAISADGNAIIAAIGEMILYFSKSSNRPIWRFEGGNAYNVAISRDSTRMAAATAGDASRAGNQVVLWNSRSKTPVWTYKADSNFHDVAFSEDGRYVSASTGCPDRRAYLFSVDTNKPVLRSDQLTGDSPVHRARVAGNGSFFAAGSEAGYGAVFLFAKDKKREIWKFVTPGGSSVRALAMTPEGNIAAATFGGDIYVFDKTSSQPTRSWKVPGAVGAIDIADDGNLVAAGGTNNQVYLFKNGQKAGAVTLAEYIQEIDVSANGKLVAAGTGGAVYFFETFTKNLDQIFPCTTVIEPPSEAEAYAQYGDSAGLGVSDRGGTFIDWIIRWVRTFFTRGQPQDSSPQSPSEGAAVCGNNLCEPSYGETKETCLDDCSGNSID